MTTAALGLALGAAVIHAFWNVLLAGTRDPEAASAVALGSGAIVCAPIAVLT